MTRNKKMISVTFDPEILESLNELISIRGGNTKGRNAKGGRGQFLAELIKAERERIRIERELEVEEELKEKGVL